MFTRSLSPWDFCVIQDKGWKYFCFSFFCLVSKHWMLEKLVYYINSIDTFIKHKVKDYSEGTSLLLVQLGLVLLYNQSVLGILFLLGRPDENKPFVSITAKFYSQLGETRISKNRMAMLPVIRKYLDAPLQLKSQF